MTMNNPNLNEKPGASTPLSATPCSADDWFLEGWTRKVGKCVNGDGDQALQTRVVKRWCKAYLRSKRQNDKARDAADDSH